jgi:HK97 family phage prohead protease
MNNGVFTLPYAFRHLARDHVPGPRHRVLGTIEGYAVPWDVVSAWPPGGQKDQLRHVFRRGAFAETLASGASVSLVVDHLPLASLGSIQADGAIEETARGLAFRKPLLDTEHGLAVARFAKHTGFAGVSFRVGYRDKRTITVGGENVVEVLRAELDHVSLQTKSAAFAESFARFRRAGKEGSGTAAEVAATFKAAPARAAAEDPSADVNLTRDAEAAWAEYTRMRRTIRGA